MFWRDFHFKAIKNNDIVPLLRFFPKLLLLGQSKNYLRNLYYFNVQLGHFKHSNTPILKVIKTLISKFPLLLTLRLLLCLHFTAFVWKVFCTLRPYDQNGARCLSYYFSVGKYFVDLTEVKSLRAVLDNVCLVSFSALELKTLIWGTSIALNRLIGQMVMKRRLSRVTIRPSHLERS